MLTKRLQALHIHGERGQSMAELALLLPLVLMLLSVMLDGGRAMQVYSTLVNAGREAAVAGAKANTSSSTLTSMIKSELDRSKVNSSLVGATVTYKTTGVPPRQIIVVNVSYPLPLITRFLPVNSLTLRTKSEMVTFW